jgi:hypothetical protein
MTETVDGAVHGFPSLEEPGFRWMDLPMRRVKRGAKRKMLRRVWRDSEQGGIGFFRCQGQ